MKRRRSSHSLAISSSIGTVAASLFLAFIAFGLGCGDGSPDASSRLACEGDETSADCTSCLLIAKYEVCKSAYEDATAACAPCSVDTSGECVPERCAAKTRAHRECASAAAIAMCGASRQDGAGGAGSGGTTGGGGSGGTAGGGGSGGTASGGGSGGTAGGGGAGAIGGDGGTGGDQPVVPERVEALSGRFLLAVALIVDSEAPIYADAQLEVVGPGGDCSTGHCTAHLTLQPLSNDRNPAPAGCPAPLEPVGSEVSVDEVVVDREGAFRVDFWDVAIGGCANPISGLQISTSLTLKATSHTGSMFCGAVEGTATEPIRMNLQGSTFGAVRIPVPPPLATVEAIASCPGR